MSHDVWRPSLYGRFRAERSRPFYDLLDLVRPRPGMRVVDLGCGTGELTADAHRRLGAVSTIGVDSSASMLEKAAPLAGDGLSFLRGDIASFTSPSGEPFDLVLSNAALHWVPDHPALLARLAAAIAPCGQLAVQIPSNQDHPSHALAHEMAREEPWRSELGGYVRETPVLPPVRYAELLRRLGFRDQHVRLQVYVHELPEPAEVVEWVRGTLLTDYEKRMAPPAFARYVDEYRERLLARIGRERPYLYTYQRILFWAER